MAASASQACEEAIGKLMIDCFGVLPGKLMWVLFTTCSDPDVWQRSSLTIEASGPNNLGHHRGQHRPK